MDKIEQILSLIRPGKSWEEKSGGLWLEDPDLDVENMARVMVKAGARLVTVSASPPDTGEFRLIYHWDMDGNLLNCVTLTSQGALPAIAGTCPAADWIEQEIHDYYAVSFTGRDLPSLMLNEHDRPGIFAGKFQRRLKAGGRQ
jgi:hypothetical protein